MGSFLETNYPSFFENLATLTVWLRGLLEVGTWKLELRQSDPDQRTLLAMTTHHGKVVEQKLRPFKCRYCTKRFATSGDRLR